MSTLGDECGTRSSEQVLMGQIVYRLGDEQRSVIERDTASRSELAHFGEQLKPGVQRDGIDLGGRAMVRNLLHSGKHRQIRIAFQIPRGDHLMARVVGIVSGKVVTPVIESLPILRTA